MLKALENAAILAGLASLPGWRYEEGKLIKDNELRNFSEALSFIVQVGLIAEKQDHHPEILNNYRRVTLKLSTHDCGGKVTEKDLTLARTLQLLCAHD